MHPNSVLGFPLMSVEDINTIIHSEENIHRFRRWTQMKDHRDVFCLRQGKNFIKKPGADEYATRAVDLIDTFN